jgi:serine O-acetyltransferase
MYRWSHFLHKKGRIGTVLSWALEWLETVVYGCLIACEAEIGRGFRIAHPIGIVIGLAKIGDNVAIWQNVTIGAIGRAGKKKSWPVIDDNVRIFASAVVAGGIRIGEGSTIGALAFINRDVPPHSLALTERTIHKPAGENEEDEI